MKVRLKTNWHPGYFRDVQHTVRLNGKEFYLFTDGSWCTSDSYEPVPTETWRDVTGECEVFRGDDIKHGDVFVIGEEGYRLRKVQLMQPEGAVVKADGIFGTQFLITDAFIVEKRDHA
jgi:hypothetical protein